jgi:peptidoglycan/xylan/chitin deacetylase (PgdA/CDA1 family)
MLQTAGLGYHEVTNDPFSTGIQGRPRSAQFTLTTAAFEEHLARVAGAAVQPTLVTQTDLTQPGRHLFLTFDDGGKSAMHAAEALARRGWRGHFFIVTSAIGQRTFVGTADMHELRDAGHVVGSHSHTHPYVFRDQTIERMVDEWRVSADIVAQILGQPCEAASVPGGHVSAAVLRSGAEAGLRYLFTTTPTLAPRNIGGCWILGRALIKATHPLHQIEALVQFRGWTAALILRQLKDAAARSMPGLFRAYATQMTDPPGGA